MFDPVINETNIQAQEFFGKDELLQLLLEGRLGEYKDERTGCEELLGCYERYTTKPKLDTPHKQYVRAGTLEIIKKLQHHKNGCCITREVSVAPYFFYNVYFIEGTTEILACIKAYDIQKTPEDVWKDAWGD